MPWREATLARIPENTERKQYLYSRYIVKEHKSESLNSNETILLCTVGNCAALAMASLEIERGDPFTPVCTQDKDQSCLKINTL